MFFTLSCFDSIFTTKFISMHNKSESHLYYFNYIWFQIPILWWVFYLFFFTFLHFLHHFFSRHLEVVL